MTRKTKKPALKRLCGQTCIEQFLVPLMAAKKNGWIQDGEPITLEMIEYLLDIGAGRFIDVFAMNPTVKEPSDVAYGLIFATLINDRDDKAQKP